MSKKAIYYDEAKRLYVTKGIGLTAVEDMLGNQVSRRQLHNWKEDGQWDEKRKKFNEQHQDLQAMVLLVAKKAVSNALDDPNPKTLLAMTRALNALEQKDALALLSGKAGDEESETDENKSDRLLKTFREAMEG